MRTFETSGLQINPVFREGCQKNARVYHFFFFFCPSSQKNTLVSSQDFLISSSVLDQSGRHESCNTFIFPRTAVRDRTSCVTVKQEKRTSPHSVFGSFSDQRRNVRICSVLPIIKHTLRPITRG